MKTKTWNAGLLVVLVLITLAVSPAQIVYGADGLPSYQLQFLGEGSPVDINNNGIVIGARLSGNIYVPLVSTRGEPWNLLPVPTGAMSVFPTDINDADVIVGVSFDTQWNATAIRWAPSGTGFVVDVLPRIPGDTSSYATAINNLGQIVGARRTLGYVPASSSGWVYSEELGVVDIATTYGLWTYPTDINDQSQILFGLELLDLDTGVTTGITGGPANYNPVNAVAINNSGMLAGSASLRSSSLNIISVFRHDGVSGWQFIAGSSRYTTVSSLNNLGDIGYGEQGAGLYLHNLGVFPLYTLVAPAVTNAGWSITGSGAKINDQRAVVTVGRNSTTGQTGTILLTAGGTLPAPTAPINFQGVPSPATYTKPFNSIELTWENTSPLTQSYMVERREIGATDWTQLSLIPPVTINSTNHSDTTVTAGVVYEYRVRADGLAGNSPWSNIITVAAPATPLDTTPPVVSLLTPTNGASLSGTITVTAQANDNVAVEYLEISFWNQYQGQEIILGSVSNAGTLTVNWNTAGLTPATYTLSAYAYDTLGNWSQADITVNVTAAARTMRVSSITLSSTLSGGRVNVTGYVYVRDSNGRALSNASVGIRWTLPGGTTLTPSAVTDYLGRARFTVSGSRGTYQLAVVGVARSGYVFDSGSSVLSKTITR